jgi:hypothetical protein
MSQVDFCACKLLDFNLGDLVEVSTLIVDLVELKKESLKFYCEQSQVIYPEKVK